MQAVNNEVADREQTLIQNTAERDAALGEFENFRQQVVQKEAEHEEAKKTAKELQGHIDLLQYELKVVTKITHLAKTFQIIE